MRVSVSLADMLQGLSRVCVQGKGRDVVVAVYCFAASNGQVCYGFGWTGVLFQRNVSLDPTS